MEFKAQLGDDIKQLERMAKFCQKIITTENTDFSNARARDLKAITEALKLMHLELEMRKTIGRIPSVAERIKSWEVMNAN